MGGLGSKGLSGKSTATIDAINDITNVTIAAIVAGEILKWDGTKWLNNTLAEAGISATGHTHLEADITDLQSYLLNITAENFADLSDIPAPTASKFLKRNAGDTAYEWADSPAVVAALNDITNVIITAIASGEIIKWDGSNWINNTLAEAGISATGHGHTASDITDLATEILARSKHTGTQLASTISDLATEILARAKHTGTQLASTISDFNTAVRTNRLDQMAIPTALVNLNAQNLDNIKKLIHDLKTITSSTTITVNFNNEDLAKLALAHNTTFSSSNLAVGKTKEIHITSASAQTMAFPSGWTFYGDKPTTTTAGKDSVLQLTSIGTTDADVKAVFVEEA